MTHTYREDGLRLRDLEEHEALALGGLIRILIRLDGTFSEAERDALEEIGDDVGTADDLWTMITRSSEELADDGAIRDKALAVTRPEARELIRYLLESVASVDSITLAEQQLLDWLDDTAWAD